MNPYIEKIEKAKKQICLNCEKEMTEVYDEIAHKYTGHLWRCENCMKDNPDLVLSIG